MSGKGRKPEGGRDFASFRDHYDRIDFGVDKSAKFNRIESEFKMKKATNHIQISHNDRQELINLIDLLDEGVLFTTLVPPEDSTDEWREDNWGCLGEPHVAAMFIDQETYTLIVDLRTEYAPCYPIMDELDRLGFHVTAVTVTPADECAGVYDRGSITETAT